MITMSCRQMGFDVVESVCGDEGIALFREHGPFDLVLTDLYYFDEIKEPPLSKSDCIRDGIQFVQSIRKINPHQQIAINEAIKYKSHSQNAEDDAPQLRISRKSLDQNIVGNIRGEAGADYLGRPPGVQ